jgi:hypothetical protein
LGNIRWPIAIQFNTHEQADSCSRLFANFFARHAEIQTSSDPTITDVFLKSREFNILSATFDNNGQDVWFVIYGDRAGIYLSA